MNVKAVWCRNIAGPSLACWCLGPIKMNANEIKKNCIIRLCDAW